MTAMTWPVRFLSDVSIKILSMYQGLNEID